MVSESVATPPETVETNLSESLEDYLEAILVIEGEKRVARPKDISHRLAVSPPAVTAALQNLAARGLVNYAPYEAVTLTASGRHLAEDVWHRHRTLQKLFTDVLQLDANEADEVACRMEHSLPPHVLDRLVDFIDFIEKSPHGEITWSKRSGFALRSEAGSPDLSPPTTQSDQSDDS
jgi:DtxR family Mn-dependent transcriptional regulator